MRDDVSELVSDLDDIIQKQARIIDRLFLLLLEYINFDDCEKEMRELEEVATILEAYKV